MNTRRLRTGAAFAYPVLVHVALLADSLLAQFTTVLNVPPDSVGGDILSDSTQVNVFDGGMFPSFADLGSPAGTSTNIELNIYGGRVGGLLTAHGGSTVNVFGGEVGNSFRANAGSKVYVSGGEIDTDFSASDGSVVNVSGGIIGRNSAAQAGSAVTISGGLIEPFFAALAGSSVAISGGNFGAGFQAASNNSLPISGGTFATFRAVAGTNVQLLGQEFRLDNQAISGLSGFGDSVSFNLPEGAILTGILSDGTPFAFSSLFQHDIDDGTLSLTVAPVAPIGPAVITGSTDPIPLGIRQGQTLIADDGSMVARNFQAFRGSTVVVEEGAEVGSDFKAAGAVVNVSGGVFSRGFTAFEYSNITVSGGTFPVDLLATDGSTVNILGGLFQNGFHTFTSHSEFSVRDDSTVNVSGGIVEDITIGMGGTLRFSGGVIGGTDDAGIEGIAAGGINAASGGRVIMTGGAVPYVIRPEVGSSVDISGGAFDGFFLAANGTMVTLEGDEFKVNGIAVDGLETDGNSVIVHLDSDDLLTGVLADGTPMFIRQTVFGVGSERDFTLRRASLPPAGPALITASTDTVPQGIRSGQVMVVDAGGRVGPSFRAGAGTTLIVQEGGVVETNLELFGASVDVSGGEVGKVRPGEAGSGIEVYDGSSVTISGGQIESLDAFGENTVLRFRGGSFHGPLQIVDGPAAVVSGGTFDGRILMRNVVAHVSGGVFDDSLTLNDSTVEISGGAFHHAVAFTRTTANISGGLFDVTPGGTLSRSVLITDATINISGGMFNDIVRLIDGSLNLFGTEFFLNGVKIDDLEMGAPMMIGARDVILSGVFADGSPFSFTLDSRSNHVGTYFNPLATLTITLVPEPTSALLLVGAGALSLLSYRNWTANRC